MFEEAFRRGDAQGHRPRRRRRVEGQRRPRPRKASRLKVRLKGSLAGGRYTAHWRITAADGDAQDGTFTSGSADAEPDRGARRARLRCRRGAGRRPRAGHAVRGRAGRPGHVRDPRARREERGTHDRGRAAGAPRRAAVRLRGPARLAPHGPAGARRHRRRDPLARGGWRPTASCASRCSPGRPSARATSCGRRSSATRTGRRPRGSARPAPRTRRRSRASPRPRRPATPAAMGGGTPVPAATPAPAAAADDGNGARPWESSSARRPRARRRGARRGLRRRERVPA
jgi:hypothetical protein